MSIRQLFIGFLFCYSIACSKKTTPGTNPPPPTQNTTTFTNPLLPSGPDPWVVQLDSNYYYTNTFGKKIAVYTTTKMSELDKAPITTIWSPPASGNYSNNIWAPELHYINGKWYTYFAADDGNIANHRMYVLENDSSDPLSNEWKFKGKIADRSDKWAIDGTVLDYNGKLYFIWSGWPGDVNVEQDLYIAEMSDPATIQGDRVLLSAPTYPWEKVGVSSSTPIVNEGPEVLKNSIGRVFITYSASGCWTDSYAIGLLSLKEGGDPMNPADWMKSPNPVFTGKPENGAYAPGHNGFFKSKDGKEDWIIYHANTYPGQGCGDTRNPRMQKFTWNADGTPNFGEPVKINTPIQKPSGE